MLTLQQPYDLILSIFSACGMCVPLTRTKTFCDSVTTWQSSRKSGVFLHELVVIVRSAESDKCGTGVEGRAWNGEDAGRNALPQCTAGACFTTVCLFTCGPLAARPNQIGLAIYIASIVLPN